MANSDRKPYLSATTLTQDLLDACADNLVNQLELIVDIDTPIGMIHVSDRNKYVGSTFYESRLVFPIIKRTVGEFLSADLQFSTIQLEINNSDGRFNDIIPAGADYDGWIGRSVSIKLGLSDIASTYTEIFNGNVTEEGGFKRTTKSFTLNARDKFDAINQNFPKNVFSKASYPDIEDDKVNNTVPLIWGDWTTEVEPDGASVPATPVNGKDPDVNGDTSFSTRLDLVISDNVNTFFDDTEVYLVRADKFYQMDAGDIVNINADKNFFRILQSATAPSGTTLIDGAAFEYKSGDRFFVKVKGKDLGAYDDNIIEQARDILLSFSGLGSGDFDANWDAIRDKAAPAESAVAAFKSRVWIAEPQPCLTYVLSMLEQVRVEAFTDRNLKLKLLPIHFDEFESAPTYEVKDWDIERDSFVPNLDERNNFNRSKGVFNFLPNRNEELQETAVYRNSPAITQASKEISKEIFFPNMYLETDVSLQVQEILKLTSSYLENIDVNLTWRSLLLDIGQFVRINVDIQGTQFSQVPALVREIGYDPAGLKLPCRLWSFQMVPFPGWSPGFSGITGGSTATIVQE